MSGVPPFILNQALEREQKWLGKFASGFRTVALGCKDVKLKHVQSLRKQVFMFYSFRVQHEERFYMVYTSMKCFECGDMGHKHVACQLRQHTAGLAEADRGDRSGEVAPPASAAVATSSMRGASVADA